MALGPTDLNKWAPTDDRIVDSMELFVDYALQNKLAPLKEDQYRIIFPKDWFKGIIEGSPLRHLGKLKERYRNAKWGEVDGAIMGDGSAILTLREHKRHYPNPF